MMRECMRTQEEGKQRPWPEHQHEGKRQHSSTDQHHVSAHGRIDTTEGSKSEDEGFGA